MVFRHAALAAVTIVALTSIAFEPAAMAQGKKGGDPKKGDPKTAPAPAAAPATTPAATPAATAPATPAEPAAGDAEKDKEKEDKRAVYISLDIGFTRPDVGGLSDNTGLDKTSANGILAGIGLGYRFKEFRLGARFRDSSTTELSLWSLMGEIGYGLPFRPVSPIFFVHAGYMFSTDVERAAIASALPRGNVLTPQVELDGLVVGGELSAAVWLTKFLRIGPFIGLDFTWLHRSQAALPQSIVPLTDETKNNPLFSDSGSGVGYVLNIGLRGTGDIAF